MRDSITDGYPEALRWFLEQTNKHYALVASGKQSHIGQEVCDMYHWAVSGIIDAMALKRKQPRMVKDSTSWNASKTPKIWFA